MAINRKLGRETSQRKAMLRGLVTSFLQNGKIVTTQARAKEVQSVVEKLVSLAVNEVDNFTSKQVKVTAAKRVNGPGSAKVTKTVTREVVDKKTGEKITKKYQVVDREEKTDMVTVDSPSRLNARRQIIKWVYRLKDEDGERISVVDKLFEEIAPKYKERNGGYTRIYKLGVRRGDSAEMAMLTFV